jgi:hypothetical protein
MTTAPKKTPKNTRNAAPKASKAGAGKTRPTGPVPSDARRALRRGEYVESAGGGLPPQPTATDGGGLVHFLAGMRCVWCKALNASWLWADGSTVECAECGQTSLVVGETPTGSGEGA